ncbi:uncharacterized protein TEOVI_000407400 [Trypanosoma equiperdum]|uniref:Uncharacterized protein n=2 Tax=Trypanozoon TaxID=39700 RepID=Q38CE6_TRYB2|nr:hypothetical protein, conserved [Trypanosoma brucei brucei TREU927]EAN77524.1 hypothetical protein, conserved [Trypanosoma brucei brucei TREU927]SCU72497.1 hypothetical protein, conserved [Trypanosoma equiperdum]
MTLGPTTRVTVNVTGTVTVPLHLNALESLDDAPLQEEIMREAVRLSLAEQLGGFDNFTVTSARKGGNHVCEARLDVGDLCSIIADVKNAYEHGERRLRELQQLITAIREQLKESGREGGSEDEDITVPGIVKVVSDMVEDALRGPGESSLSAAIREVSNDKSWLEEVPVGDRSGGAASKSDEDSPSGVGYTRLPDSGEDSNGSERQLE